MEIRLCRTQTAKQQHTLDDRDNALKHETHIAEVVE